MCTKELFLEGGGVKLRPEREADTSIVLVVQNVKMKMEAQHLFPLLNHRDLLGNPLPLPATTFYSSLLKHKHIKRYEH